MRLKKVISFVICIDISDIRDVCLFNTSKTHKQSHCLAMSLSDLGHCHSDFVRDYSLHRDTTLATYLGMLLRAVQGEETALPSPSTLLFLMIKEKKPADDHGGKSEKLQHRRKLTTVNHIFRRLEVPTADFSEYVMHLSFLAHSIRGWGGCAYSLQGAMENPILSYVFPWQWGHVVCLTTGLSTEAWWLSEWNYFSGWDHWVAVLSQKGGGWRMEEMRGRLYSGFMHMQYSKSTADWINMLNIHGTGQIVQISMIMLFPGSLTTSHLSVSGVKVVSIQDATHPNFFWLSDHIVCSGPRRDCSHCALLLNLRNLPVTSYSPKDKTLNLLCYGSDRGTRGYFQENLVLVITWWWSDLVWIHKCRWRLSALVWCIAVLHKDQWIDKG